MSNFLHRIVSSVRWDITHHWWWQIAWIAVAVLYILMAGTVIREVARWCSEKQRKHLRNATMARLQGDKGHSTAPIEELIKLARKIKVLQEYSAGKLIICMGNIYESRYSVNIFARFIESLLHHFPDERNYKNVAYYLLSCTPAYRQEFVKNLRRHMADRKKLIECLCVISGEWAIAPQTIYLEALAQ